LRVKGGVPGYVRILLWVQWIGLEVTPKQKRRQSPAFVEGIQGIDFGGISGCVYRIDCGAAGVAGGLLCLYILKRKNIKDTHQNTESIPKASLVIFSGKMQVQK
jgi:hypothetical protein